MGDQERITRREATVVLGVGTIALLTGCHAGIKPEASPTSTSTPRPTATQRPTQTATERPTETLSPTPTEIIKWQQIEDNINAFLNKEPEMQFPVTEEEKRLFRYGFQSHPKILPIGYYEVHTSSYSDIIFHKFVRIQGVLLGYTICLLNRFR